VVAADVTSAGPMTPDSRGDHRGVGPDPVGPQQLGVRGLGQQRLVAPLHRRDSAAGRELHQRCWVRDLPIDRDPAEPTPRDRVADLPAQALLAQPVAGTSSTSTAGRSPSAWTAGPPAGRRTARTARRIPGHPAVHRPGRAPPAAAAPPAATPPPQAHLDRSGPQHPPLQGSPNLRPLHDLVIHTRNDAATPSKTPALHGKSLKLSQVEVASRSPTHKRTSQPSGSRRSRCH